MVSFTLKCFDEFRVTEKTTDLAKLKEFRKTFFFFIMFTACLKFSSKKITEPVLLVFFFLFFFCFCFLVVCFLFFVFIFDTTPFSYKISCGHFSKIIVPLKFPKTFFFFFKNVVRTCKITKINMLSKYPKAVTCYFANFNF